MEHDVVICESCRPQAGAARREAEGAALAATLERALPAGFGLRRVACMTMCGDAVALAFRAPGKATYLFAGVRAGDAADVVAFARLFAASPDGWIEDARPAGRLRLCLRGRIPA